MTHPVTMDAREARTLKLIDRLGRGKQHWIDFTWPGGTLRCRIRCLTNSEIQEAGAGAVLRFKALGVELQPLLSEDFADEIVTQRLWRALEDPERPIAGSRHGRCEPLFEDVNQFRDATVVNERAAVFATYLELDENIDPEAGVLTKADADAITEAVKKKDEGALRGFGASTLRAWLLTTASPPAS